LCPKVRLRSTSKNEMLITLLILLILLSATLSGSETALFSLSTMKVRHFKRSENLRQRRVAKLLSTPLDLLVTILMLNVVMNILVQNVVSSIFGNYSGFLTTVGIPLALTLIFGEVIPKSIALSNNSLISQAIAPSISFCMNLFGPIRMGLKKLTKFISYFFFFFLRREKEISIPELMHALKASKDFGVLGRDEAKLIRGYLDLEEDIVKEHIRPRQEIVYFDTSRPIEKLADLFVKEEVSRLPICEGDLEEIIGILDAKDLLMLDPNHLTLDGVKAHVKSPFFVPEGVQAKSLLRQMYDEGETLAMVVDEYGAISGLITREDLVEVVIGEIADRRDLKALYTRATDDVIIASGKMEISEFEEIFETELISPNNMVTLGGWLTEQMGDIPQSGDKWETETFLFHILASTKTRVRRIYIRRKKVKAK